MSPLLFALYTTDLARHVVDAEVVQFADDVTLVVRAPSKDELQQKVERALEQYQRYLAEHRMAVAPAKTQLLLSGSTAALRRLANFTCELAGHEARPMEAIKVLGVLLDSQLSWSAQSAVAAGRSRAAARQVLRATRYLRAEDRAKIMRALALPPLDYCQCALAQPSAAAEDTLNRAYLYAARLANGGGGPRRTDGSSRSEEARRRFGWTTWTRRRTADAACFAAKIWHNRVPARLCEHLDEPPSADGTFAAACRRRPRLNCPQHRKMIALKSFSQWAPRMLTQVILGTLLPHEPRPPPSPSPPPVQKPPVDTERTERIAYYAELTETYAGVPERFEEGKVLVWTDGGCVQSQKKAAAAIFYGDSSPLNTAILVDDPPTSARAELAALVWVLRNEERPCHVITDCEYVHRGFTEWRHSWRARAWYRHPLDAELRNHSDLWREIDVLLARRAPNSVSTEWVKGHPIRRHVAELRTTDLRAWGNSAADGLATVGMRQMSGAQRKMGWRKPSAELRTISATGG
jgi:ribonuclease HI